MPNLDWKVIWAVVAGLVVFEVGRRLVGRVTGV